MGKEMDKEETTRNTIKQGLLISEHVNLVDVRLLNAKCKQKPETFERRKRAYNIAHSASVVVSEDSKFIQVIAHFDFTAFNEGDAQKPQEPLMVIDTDFLLLYTIKDIQGTSKQSLQSFADMNGIFNAWPYWREYVQNTIVRMGLPPLTIPVFRLFSPEKPKTPTKKVVAKEKSLPKKKTTKKTNKS